MLFGKICSFVIVSVAMFKVTHSQFPQFGFPNFFGNQQAFRPQQQQGVFGSPQQNGAQNFQPNPFIANPFPQQFFPFPNSFNGQSNQGQNQNRPQNNYRPQNNNRPQNQNQRPPTQQNNNAQQTQRPVVATAAPPVTQAATSRPTTPPNVDRIDDRISQRKCNEYAKLIRKTVQVASLAFDSSVQDVQVTQCDATTGLIVGGVAANPGEFPHMAAIGYPNFNGGISFNCGGSLISELFVLTAAHCSKADRVSPTTVRLGDQDLKIKENNLPEVDIPIESFINHEGYNKETRENDIAVIKMKQPAKFNKNIRPACLQQTLNIGKTKAVASGWGYIEVGGSTSDILQKVQLDIIDNEQCSQLYNDEDNYHIYPSQLCAGVLKGGKDTCGGDSGGPLQITIANQCVFSIIGLTSYGSTYCGAKNSPGIYTRVSSYLDWIEGKVWGT